MQRVLSLDGRRFRVEAHPEEGGAVRVQLHLEGGTTTAAAVPTPAGWAVREGRRTLEAGVTRHRSGTLIIELEGESFRFESDGPGAASTAVARSGAGKAPGPSEVRTPMPGKVVRILRSEGDRVEAGDAVLVFEAMKMQNEITAPAGGVVAKMPFSAGTPLESGKLLFTVEPAALP